jgi:hypothetical protein
MNPSDILQKLHTHYLWAHRWRIETDYLEDISAADAQLALTEGAQPGPLGLARGPPAPE